jgi:hypothetical protein
MSDWPAVFFDTSNQLEFSRITKTSDASELENELAHLLEPARSGISPLVLPRLHKDGTFAFYLMANDQQQLGELRDILTSYFGNTYFHFFHQIHTSSGDPLEKKLLTRFSSGFLRLEVRSTFCKDNAKIKDLAGTLSKILFRYQEKPLFQVGASRAVGRILRDFFTAINRGDGGIALEYVSELSERQLLNPLNLLSLEFQALATAGRWSEILDNEKKLLDAITGVTSHNVTVVILQALRSEGFQLDLICGRTPDEVLANYAPIQALFLKPPVIPISDEEAWQTWSIGAMLFGYDQIQTAVPNQLKKMAWWQQLSTWLQEEAQNVAPSSMVLPLQTLLSDHPSEHAAARLITHSVNAIESENLKIYQRLKSYPDNIVANAISGKKLLSILWDALSEIGDESTINNWRDVFDLLNQGSEISKIQQKLNECLTDWGEDRWESAPFKFVLATGDGSILRNILPQLLPWLVKNSIKISMENLVEILESLASDEMVSAEDLALSGDLFGLITELPLKATDYREVLDCIDLIWNKVKSKTSINYYLDVFDLIADAPCVDLERRGGLWVDFQKFLIKHWTKLDEPQKHSAFLLAEELIGTNTHFPLVHDTQEKSEAANIISLRGKTLAIYSLTEGAAKRAASILSEKYPGLTINLNHDKTATKGLLSLADKADFFVFTSGSAAHQAFYPVTDRRKDLIYPAGKGSTSILRAFDERLALMV